MSVTSLTKVIAKVAEEEVEKVAKDAQKIMQQQAPYPTGAERGKGSESTGATRDSIVCQKINSFTYSIHPETDYAYYAENGRRAIDLRGTGRLMAWTDKRGRKHVTPYVSAMEGWHFVEKTAEIIRAKYGR